MGLYLPDELCRQVFLGRLEALLDAERTRSEHDPSYMATDDLGSMRPSAATYVEDRGRNHHTFSTAH